MKELKEYFKEYNKLEIEIEKLDDLYCRELDEYPPRAQELSNQIDDVADKQDIVVANACLDHSITTTEFHELNK